MYNNPMIPMAASAGSAALAMTGAGEAFWYALSGFALLALGLAIKRIVQVRALKP
ncbi:MAG: hypothetical protein WCC45_08620 [Paeniglutamicibacter sp.]